MNDVTHRCHQRQGFTLVELLVALVIMASLVTVTAVSIETTHNRVRADKTASIGRQVIEDFERSDSLSFVSDFGRLPQDSDEVKFLFSQKVTDTGLDEHSAVAYQFRSLALPSTPTPGLPVGSDYTKFQDAFGNPTLGVGWRGPYSLITELRVEADEASEFLDGWKSEWEVLLDGGSFSGLRSLGRDGTSGGLDWQDADIEFPLRRNLVTENVDLQGQVLVRDADGVEYTSQAQFSSLTLKVIYFTPDFASNFALNASTENIAIVEFTWEHLSGTWSENPVRPEEASDNPFLFRLSGLTAGHRAIFVYAIGTPTGKSQAHYGGGVQLVQIHPGTNRIEYMLTEL